MDALDPAGAGRNTFAAQAGDLIAAWSGDGAALGRVATLLPGGRTPTLDELHAGGRRRLERQGRSAPATGTLGRDDAQALIADLYQFASWDALLAFAAAVTDPASATARFERAADAVITGDLATLDALLRADPALAHARSARAHQATLLIYTAANGVEDFRQRTPADVVAVARRLLDAGAEVDAVERSRGTTLGLAATSYHPAKAGVMRELLALLLDAGADVNGAPGGWNPLLAALHNGRGHAAACLAERGARLDLEGAAGVGRLDVVRTCFDDAGRLRPPSTEAQLLDGYAWACEFGHTGVVDFLLDHGVTVEAAVRHHGQAGLHWAAYEAHPDLVALLLRRGTPVNAKDRTFDGTPLGWALYGWAAGVPEAVPANYYAVVEQLIAAGATVERSWLDEEQRGFPLERRLRDDPRMRAVLGALR